MKNLLIAIFALVTLALAPASRAQLIGGDIQLVSKASDLSLLKVGSAVKYVLVLGWTNVNDGGGGLYRWVTASAVSTNYAAIASARVTTGQFIWLPGIMASTRAPRTQTIATNSTVLAEASTIRVGGEGGAITINSAPILADGVDGQELTIEGTTNAVTFTDEGGHPSSNLALGSGTRAVGAGDILKLKFSATLGTWQEQAFVNN